MVLFLRKIINFFKGKKKARDEDIPKEKKLYEIIEEEKEEIEIYSIWDFLHFIENSQAFHISSVLSFNEWVSMEEIKRRIKELFGVEYKNDRSLYPYIKTLVDCGMLESINVGGKRKWRKKELLIKLKKKKEKEEEKVRSLQRVI